MRLLKEQFKSDIKEAVDKKYEIPGKAAINKRNKSDILIEIWVEMIEELREI